MIRHGNGTSLLVLAALLASFGCANSNQEKKIKIGVSVPAADHGWTAGVGYWAKAQMDRYPEVEWIYSTAGEPAKQTSDIEDMMTQQVAGLVLLATEPNAIASVAKQAKDRGIFIVSVDRGSDTLTPTVDVFLEATKKPSAGRAPSTWSSGCRARGRL